ncbi:MAG: flagellar biosynthesis anti-sigma factor FlgM [Planctomycetales bacterium]|nr:flagellar biosynthesis anti-sigma factor FlgM [Planctomycetales bacterium]
MQIQGPSSLHGAQRIQGPHRVQGAAPNKATESLQAADQLDISAEADMVSRVRDIPDVRADRVAEIRAQIAAGTYETEAKLDAAVGRLLDELAG